MIKRIAFFADRSEIEESFSLNGEGDAIFEPHYNLSRGQHIPVIPAGESKRNIQRIRWGKRFSDQSHGEMQNDVMVKEATARCIVPISGFYIWKEGREKDHPFFVRMMNSSVMSVAGIIFKENGHEYCDFLQRDSNTLIQPISPQMPLLLNEKLTEKWLDGESSEKEIIKEAESLFLITDITVHRVSKKVNDPAENAETLIQPIPK
ncbi:MAG: SOS response-associated peptidase family protein [Balneolaceae bacterium]